MNTKMNADKSELLTRGVWYGLIVALGLMLFVAVFLAR